MLDTNVTRKEIAALDEQRERLAGLPASVLSMPMMDAVAHADGNGHPLIGLYGTVGEMLSVDARDILSIQYVGKKKLRKLYATLEGMMPQGTGQGGADASSQADAETSGDRTEGGPWERVRSMEDAPVILGEVSRLVEIEKALSDMPAPDDGPRSSATVVTQALAIYMRMGSMDFCNALEGAFENHASAMRC